MEHFGAPIGSSDLSELDSEISSDISEEEESSWVAWFCGLRGNEFFVEVDENYIRDDFNLTGLRNQVPYYDYALDTILDMDPPEEALTEDQQLLVDSAAELLYGLIHARFILTMPGLNAMVEKYEDVAYARCHRVFCEGQPLLPVGRSDIPRKFGVVLYCPRCNDIYYPKSRRHGKLDGAFFGTTFPHLFFLSFPALVPPPPAEVYEPRVFGFRIHRPGPARDSQVSAPSLADGEPARAAGHGAHLEFARADEAARRADREAALRAPHVDEDQARAVAAVSAPGASPPQVVSAPDDRGAAREVETATPPSSRPWNPPQPAGKADAEGEPGQATVAAATAGESHPAAAAELMVRAREDDGKYTRASPDRVLGKEGEGEGEGDDGAAAQP